METLQETTSETFKLYIPQEFNKDILSLVKQLDLNVKEIERKRDKARRLVKRTLHDLGVSQYEEPSVVDAWNVCVFEAELASTQTLSEFWDALSSQMMLTFKPSSDTNVEVLATLDKLQKVVYTALTQSLFIQFQDEKDVLKCTEQLYKTISNPSLIHWDLVKTDAFKKRFEEQHWTVFRPLMTDTLDGRLNTTLLTSIGFKEQDVISALFRDSLFDIIAYYDKTQNVFLQDLIGEFLYIDVEYLVTVPALHKESNRCLVISRRAPFLSVSYYADEESLEKMKRGDFFKDEENIVQNLLDLQKKEEVPTTLKLMVSEKFKPKLFDAFYELYLDKFGNESKQERKRDMLKQLFSRGASDFFGVEAKKADVGTEWERCIKVAESQNHVTVFDFFEVLSKEIQQTFQMRLASGWGAPEKERILCFTLYTALIQSLFDKFVFVHDKNLDTCTKRLQQAITNPSVIFWDEIDKKDFNTRLKEQWHAFRPLMHQTVLNRSIPSLGLFNGLGLELNDFTKAFFSEHPYKKVEFNYPFEIIQQIACRIESYWFDQFRLVNKTFYNALEKTDILRKEHRLYILSNDYLLKALIGNPVFFGNNFLLTDPTDKHLSYNYCVTSMQAPYAIVSYGGNQGQWDKILGGYVFVDSDKKINILTAYGNINFYVQLLKMDALVPYTERPAFERVSVKFTHNLSDSRDKKVVISLNEKEVLVDILCKSSPFKSAALGIPFFKSENYHAKFNMAYFSAEHPIEVQAVLQS